MTPEPTSHLCECAKCGKRMRYNVPRLGAAGGWAHSDTGSPLCGEPPPLKACVMTFRRRKK